MADGPSQRGEPPEYKGERGRKSFLLRLPAPLLAELRAWASSEVRSLNGHIEYLLREALRRRGRGGGGRG